jgi:hypothetical protein
MLVHLDAPEGFGTGTSPSLYPAESQSEKWPLTGLAFSRERGFAREKQPFGRPAVSQIFPDGQHFPVSFIGGRDDALPFRADGISPCPSDP